MAPWSTHHDIDQCSPFLVLYLQGLGLLWPVSRYVLQLSWALRLLWPVQAHSPFKDVSPPPSRCIMCASAPRGVQRQAISSKGVSAASVAPRNGHLPLFSLSMLVMTVGGACHCCQPPNVFLRIHAGAAFPRKRVPQESISCMYFFDSKGNGPLCHILMTLPLPFLLLSSSGYCL